MNNFSPNDYVELANNVVGMDKSLAHLSREERDKEVRQELGTSRAALIEIWGSAISAKSLVSYLCVCGGVYDRHCSFFWNEVCGC